MLKKTFILILVGYFVSIVQSCCSEESTYKWTGFEIQIIDNSGEEPVLSNLEIINKQALGFRIAMSDTIFYLVQNFSMIDQCRAFSCGEAYTGLHTIIDISIKTIYDFSDIFLAGSDITSLFKARDTEKIRENYVSLSDIISFFNNKNFYNYSQLATGFDLYLIDNTCKGGLQRFEISIFLSDDTVLKQQTDDLLLE